MPLELVESLHAQVIGQPLGEIQHLNRTQTFLQLGTRTAERRSIHRVDRVDTVLDEDTFTPADYLATQTDVTGVIADAVVVVNEGIQQLDTRAFLQRVTTRVVNVIETLTAVLDLEVVPVVATNEGAGVTVTQFQIVGALEDLGEHITFLVVQATVIRGTGGGKAPADIIVARIKTLIPTSSGHTGADGQLRIQLRFNLTN